jgi:hypothetical protein
MSVRAGPLEYDSEGWLRMNSYNKGVGLNFPIVNFPFICSNIPIETAYGIYIYIYISVHTIFQSLWFIL